MFKSLTGLATGSLQLSREKKLHHLFVVELRRRPSVLRQSKKDDVCDKVTLKALMLQRDVCYSQLLLRFTFEGFPRDSVLIKAIRTLIDLSDTQCAQS